MSSGDYQFPAVNQAAGQLLPGAIVDSLRRCAGHAHLLGTGLLAEPCQIDEPDGLKFIHCHLNRRLGPTSPRAKMPMFRHGTHTPVLARSWHGIAPILGICHLFVFIIRRFWHMSRTFCRQYVPGKEKIPERQNRTPGSFSLHIGLRKKPTPWSIIFSAILAKSSSELTIPSSIQRRSSPMQPLLTKA